MTIYEYVATKNPIGAKTVLNSFGEKAVPRPDILAKQLANAVNKHGKDALFRIASVHPDMNLISEYNKQVSKNNDVVEAVEEKSCGCKEKEVESLFSSAEGQEIKKAVENLSLKQDTLSNTPKESKSDSKDLMIIGAVAVIALALVMKK
jgi:hypothetical protein|tara:strand:+ start:497 stop:943 length:447 start_codon:yes stop_codon:yes gene_type:complete